MAAAAAGHQDMPALRARVLKLQQRDKSNLSKITTLLSTNQQLDEQIHHSQTTQDVHANEFTVQKPVDVFGDFNFQNISDHASQPNHA